MTIRRALSGILIVFTFLVFSSCKFNDLSVRSADVDFSDNIKAQVLFNDTLYNTVLSYKDGCFQINFSDENSLLGGMYIRLTEKDYKITYGDMSFSGAAECFTENTMVSVLYDMMKSYSGVISFSEYNPDNKCYTLGTTINNSFVDMEAYFSDGEAFLSIEIT